MEPYNLIAQWTGWPVIVAIMLAKLCLKPTGEIGHGLTRMHTDETELIYPCSSVSKILPHSSKIRLMTNHCVTERVLRHATTSGVHTVPAAVRVAHRPTAVRRMTLIPTRIIHSILMKPLCTTEEICGIL
jgi:hypothetical protein